MRLTEKIKEAINTENKLSDLQIQKFKILNELVNASIDNQNECKNYVNVYSNPQSCLLCENRNNFTGK